jgi:oligoendopeptidase F
MTRLLPTLAGVTLALATLPLAAQPAASATVASDPRLVWDLTRVYPSDAAWDAERQALAAELPRLQALKGTLGRDAAALREALDQVSAARQRLRRLWVYASTQTSTQYGDRRNQERSALASSLWGEFSAAVAWVDPELQALGAARTAAFQAAEPGLAKHAVRIRQAQRQAPHTLAPETEAALAAMDPVLDSFGQMRELLVNADVAWPTLAVDGQNVRLNSTGHAQLRTHPDRTVRQQAFAGYFKTHAQFESTLGALLAQRVKLGVTEAGLRRHASAAAASLFESEVPEPVLRTLVAEVNRSLPSLHRYFRLRQKLLNLPDLQYHDIYPDLVRWEQRYPVDDAARLTLAAMRPLGEEYQGQLAFALQARTMHVRPQPGKRGGAYATSVYGLTPYIFLNHTDTYESLVTFAHEWGHGMHAVLSQRAQPPESAQYPLFLAEIASMTNEVLLAEHLLKQASSRDERLFLLSELLERMRAGFFRQTMFAEFELAAHDAQQRGEALSGKRFTEMYCGLLRKYHGSDQGVMAIDPAYCVEWASVPHFHRPFYVYAYATSSAAARFFGERIARGEPGMRETYLGVLRAGGSVPPHELLSKAGLDLSSPAPYRALVARMEAVMEEMESLLR